MPDLLDRMRSQKAEGPFGALPGNRTAGVKHFLGYADLPLEDQVLITEVCKRVRPSALIQSADRLYLVEHEPAGERTGGQAHGYTVRTLFLHGLEGLPAETPGPPAVGRREDRTPAGSPGTAGRVGAVVPTLSATGPACTPPAAPPRPVAHEAVPGPTAVPPSRSEAYATPRRTSSAGTVFLFALLSLLFAATGYWAGSSQTRAQEPVPGELNEAVAKLVSELKYHRTSSQAVRDDIDQASALFKTLSKDQKDDALVLRRLTQETQAKWQQEALKVVSLEARREELETNLSKSQNRVKTLETELGRLKTGPTKNKIRDGLTRFWEERGDVKITKESLEAFLKAFETTWTTHVQSPP